MTLASDTRRSPGTPRQFTCPSGMLPGFRFRGPLNAVVRPAVSERPEGAPLWKKGGATSGGSLCRLCESLVRAICLGAPWAVGVRWGWCPVARPGAGGPRERGVRIVQMLCRRRASWMRRTAM